MRQPHAIAKAETVRGNPARLGRSVHAVPRQGAGTGRAGGAAAPRPQRASLAPPAETLLSWEIETLTGVWRGSGSRSSPLVDAFVVSMCSTLGRPGWLVAVSMPPRERPTPGNIYPARKARSSA